VPCMDQWQSSFSLGGLTLGRAAILISMVIVGSACGSSTGDQQLVVSAAASLAGVFTEIEEAFEEANPGVDVEMNFAGSSRLKEQILEGAPVDVFASANEEAMTVVTAAILPDSVPQVFALNSLAIAVPAGNSAGVAGLDDFADPQLFVGLCIAAVPCGQYAHQTLRSAGVVPSVDSEEPDVRALLLKIELGELDLGIVYITDVIGAAGSVESVAIPSLHNTVATYPIVSLATGENQAVADAFVAYVLSDMGRQILASYGFELP
jgi:molybdate transport system substrate-binding protein